MEEPVAALDGLRDKGMFVAVPLLADGEHQATFALQVTLPNTPRSQRGSLDLLRHVAMEVTVEIGRTRMTVQELLSLHPGEVVELDRAASAPADLLVNGTLIARGEVVVVDEDFGLRISEIVTDAAAELGDGPRMTWMIIRLILSLGFIAVVLLWAARLAKKKGLGQGSGLIEVVARQRMGRSSTVNVIRIADVVLVIGATEEQVTLLAEVDCRGGRGGARRARAGAPRASRRTGRPRSPAVAGATPAPAPRASPAPRSRARWPARCSTAPAGAPSCTSCASGRCASHDDAARAPPRGAGGPVDPSALRPAAARWRSRCVMALAGPASAAPDGADRAHRAGRARRPRRRHRGHLASATARPAARSR